MTNRCANAIFDMMENPAQSELKRPERPPPEAGIVALYHWMEEIETFHQIQAIQAAPRHPPKHPYKPR